MSVAPGGPGATGPADRPGTGGEPDGSPLWGGRFAVAPAAEAQDLGRSLGFDIRLVREDVEAGVAHVHALEEAGLLDEGEGDLLVSVLREVGEEIASGVFVFHPADEDVHSAVERGVTERLGEIGEKLHAGRSRNDLVVTDLRLWILGRGGEIVRRLERLVRALVAHAREHAATVMPGTTHGRPAQPVTLGHHLLAHAWALLRDRERFDQWSSRTSVSPLGAGALATSSLPLDPVVTAERLGFARAFANSLDAVSDRDFAQEFLAVSTICGTHLSRVAADLIRWSDEALGWAELDEAYSTGSSMMPQKRNPDVAELSRAKAARLLGDFTAVTTMLAGLPLGYQRDLQEDKEPVFDAVDTLRAVIPALAGCVETIRFRPEAMRRAAAAEGLFATDLAEELVKGGVPFREAHRRVGALLKELDAQGRTLRELGEGEWLHHGLPGGAALLDPDRAVRVRSMPGGPSPESVSAQAEAIEAAMSADVGHRWAAEE
ncbi:MAG TPA: argininosuccinate lyase [Actinomycetota bacterium]